MSCSPLVGQFYVLKTPRSGVYVCDENDNSIEIEMSRAMIQMRYRMSVCIGGNSIGKDTVSGRVKVDTTGAGNLNIGYCNGNHAPSSGPAQYSNEWPGPNGMPDVTCGREDEPACEGGFCEDNSVVIEE